MVIGADKEINADVVFGVQWTWSEQTLEEISMCVSQKLDQGVLNLVYVPIKALRDPYNHLIPVMIINMIGSSCHMLKFKLKLSLY